MRTITFAHNPTGWADGAPIPGGMSAAHIDPVTRHLADGTWVETDQPLAGDQHLNVYYTHRRTYGANRERGGRSVFAGHGIADKAWRNAGKVRDFDFVTTSGPAWSQRIARGGYPATRILEVGYPKLDPLFAGEIPSPWPERDGRIRVLWAPTHGGGGEKYRHATSPPATAGAQRTTHWRRDEILAALPSSEFHVVEALHPRHRPDGRSTLAEYVGADVVIADGGSTIYEAWALGLPVVFPDWATAAAHLNRRADTFEAHIYRAGIGRHAATVDQLAPAVVDAAAGGITDPEVDLVEVILPASLRGRGGELLAEALTDIAGGWLPAKGHTFIMRRHDNGTTVKVLALSDRARRLRSAGWELVG